MTDTLTQRVAFEKWAESEGLPIERFNHQPDMYQDRVTHLCWSAIEASGAQHLRGFNLLSEKQPNIGEYCLCICNAGAHGGVYFCTSTYHGLKNESTCGFYCHSVIAWIGESQMRNMAKQALAALPPELRGKK